MLNGKFDWQKIISWENLIKWPLYGVIFLAPFFFLPWGAYPVALSKQILISSLAFLSLFGYLGKSLKEGKVIYRSIDKFLIGFILTVGISLLLSNSFLPGIFGLSGFENDSFINIISLVLVFFLAAAIFKIEDLKYILSFSLISSGLLAVAGLFQIFGIYVFQFDFSKFSDFNPLGSVLSLAVFLGSNLILIFSLLISFDLSKIKKIILWLLFALFLFYLLLVNYQFIWILIAVSAFFILALKLALEGVQKKDINSIIFLITIAVFLYFAALPISQWFGINITPELFVNFSQNANIVKNTLFNDIKSFSGIKNVLFGIGGGNFVYEYLKSRPVELNYENIIDLFSLRFNSGYSLLMTYFVVFGLIGGFLFIVYIGWNFFQTFKLAIKKRDIEFLPILAFIFYIILAIVFDNISLILFLSLFLALAAVKIFSEKTLEFNLFLTPQRIFFLSLIIIILMSSAVYGIYYNGSRLAGAIYYSLSNKNFAKDETDEAISKMLQAVNWDNKNEIYLRSLSGLFLRKLNSAQAASDDLQNSINFAQAAVNLNKIESLNYFSLGAAYENAVKLLNNQKSGTEQDNNILNTYNLAVKNYQDAAKFDPKNPAIHLSLARLHLFFGKYDKAEKAVENSLALKPNYAAAYILSAQILDNQGKLKEAINKAEQAFQIDFNNPNILSSLGTLYYKDNQFELAQAILEKAKELSDKDMNINYVLGLVYDKMKQKEKALAEFQKILEINPANENIKKIIENIKSGKSALLENKINMK